MLTAARSTDDLVEASSLGADDYLSKPFRSPSSSRVWARPAAAPARPRPANLSAGDLGLDPARRVATRPAANDNDKGFAVLEALLAGRATSTPRSCSNAPGTRTSTPSPTSSA